MELGIYDVSNETVAKREGLRSGRFWNRSSLRLAAELRFSECHWRASAFT